MALPDSYLMTSKNLRPIIDASVKAQAPPKFTLKFLEGLGFKSNNDRLFIRVFKDLELLDGSGVPTPIYYDFIDSSRTKEILGQQIMKVYSDLFALNTKAYEMSKADVKNKFKTLTQGAKSDNILDLMAKTFVALCEQAEFIDKVQETSENKDVTLLDSESDEKQPSVEEFISKQITTEMHYNIQIHLPDTKDIAVYNAIFKSLKDHLL